MLKKLLGESAIYGISSIVTKLIGIFLVPIYTQVFAPQDYGIVALTMSTFSLLGMLVVLGLDNSAALYFYEYKEVELQKKPISNWFFSQLIFSIVVATSVISFSSTFANLLFDSPQYYYILVLASLALVFTTFTSVLQKWLRFQRKAVATVIVTLSISLFNIFLNVLFVLYYDMGLKGVFLANLVGSLSGFFVCIIMMRKWLSLAHIDFTLLKKMMKFGLPLVPAALAYWLSNSSASYFINFSLSKTEVGLFQIGSSVASGVLLITGAFQMAIGPFIFSQKDEPYIKDLINKVFIGYLALTGVIVMAVSTFSYEILVLLTRESYYAAKGVVPILSINFLLLGLNYIGALGLNLYKNNKPYMVAIILGSIINVILFFILIPIFGKEGAAWSMTIANIIATGLIFKFSIKYYPIDYSFKVGVFIFIISVISSLVLNGWLPVDIVSGLIYKGLSLSIVSGIIFLLSYKYIKRIQTVKLT